jgi:uncharacterized protein YjbJ (UPF0337 family)
MGSDLDGKAKHVGGKLKEGLGEVLGDRKLEREGRLQQFEGEAEQDAKRAEEALEEATDRQVAARTARKASEGR